jgi:hypothetical protein
MIMTTDELLEKLPSHIGNCLGDSESLNLHNDGKDWLASYGIEGEFLCMNPNAKEPPYDNAFAYGRTPNEALQGLYDWLIKHKLL